MKMAMRARRALALVISLASLLPATRAVTLRVPDDATRTSQAVYAAESAVTPLPSPGIEDLRFLKRQNDCIRGCYASAVTRSSNCSPDDLQCVCDVSVAISIWVEAATCIVVRCGGRPAYQGEFVHRHHSNCTG